MSSSEINSFKNQGTIKYIHFSKWKCIGNQAKLFELHWASSFLEVGTRFWVLKRHYKENRCALLGSKQATKETTPYIYIYIFKKTGV